MINHLTGFLNKCRLAFKRDNHPEISSSVKQKTPRPSALVFSVSRMTSFSVTIPYVMFLISLISNITELTCQLAIISEWRCTENDQAQVAKKHYIINKRLCSQCFHDLFNL